jgi:hypothetical protein
MVQLYRNIVVRTLKKNKWGQIPHYEKKFKKYTHMAEGDEFWRGNDAWKTSKLLVKKTVSPSI